MKIDRKKFISGNWKMHGSKESVKTLVQALQEGLENIQSEVVVFPTALHVPMVSEMLQNSSIGFGVQNIYPKESGAFTGEISASMAKEFNCSYVLVGHSERRMLFAENNDFITQKFLAAQTAGLTPVLCVGETLEARNTGQTESIVQTQLNAVIQSAGVTALNNCIIAYEPVWAIGTGFSATPEQAQNVHSFIRKTVRELDEGVANNLRIVYGGSVKAKSADKILSMPDVDGALIGGASLIAEEFLAICRIAG